MFPKSKGFDKQGKALALTVTGEIYQPVRIYYEVHQKNAVLGRFKRLRCIEFDEPRNRWVWLYRDEAKNIEFANSYRDISKELRPIVLGSFSWEGDQELRLDVRSIERVIKAILFFDNKINQRIAKLTTLKIVNKLFSSPLSLEEMMEHHSLFFEQYSAVNPKDEILQMKQISSQIQDQRERREAAWSYLNKQMKKSLPEVEELEAHFYEDGIKSLELALKVRQVEAFEHWKGNKNFSQFDIVQKMLKNFE